MKNILIAILLSVALVAPVAAQEKLQPQQQVEIMINSVLEILQQTDLPAPEKKALVSGRVQQYLDIASMSQRTLGPYWKDASVEQRQRFSDLFVQVLEGTYLNKINDYSGGQVQYLQQRVKDDKAIIDTKFVSADLQIPVQYKMIYVNDAWQVFDVVIEGVSLIRNYRSSYGEIIRRDGYDGLFALMEQKVADMQGTAQPQM